MYYYSDKGQKLNTDDYNYLNQGNCALVYQKDNTIFKQYHLNTASDERVTKEMFNFLKSLNNEYLMTPYNLYYYSRLKSLLSNIKNKQVDGYTAKFYQEDLTNVLEIEYLLNSLNEIEKLFHLLKNNGIIANDIKVKNCVIMRDKIVVIDFDKFYFLKDNNFIRHYTAEQLDILMNQKIINLFRDITTKLTGTYRKDLFKNLEKEKNAMNELNRILKPYHNIRELESR